MGGVYSLKRKLGFLTFLSYFSGKISKVAVFALYCVGRFRFLLMPCLISVNTS